MYIQNWMYLRRVWCLPPTIFINVVNVLLHIIILLYCIFTSPTYFWTNSDPITLIKQASVLFATARAHSVFPVPGGPNSNTPFGGSIPKFTNFSGCNATHKNVQKEYRGCQILSVETRVYEIKVKWTVFHKMLFFKLNIRLPKSISSRHHKNVSIYVV